MPNTPGLITVIESGTEMAILIDGNPVPWPVLIGPEDPVELRIQPGGRPPAIRVTIPADRVEVVSAKHATRATGFIRETSRIALEEVGHGRSGGATQEETGRSVGAEAGPDVSDR